MTRPAALKGEAVFATLFSGIFLALGAQMAFLQVWYEEKGLTEAEIGLVNVLAFAVRVFAGVALPAASDRAGRPGAALALFAIVGAAAAGAHLIAPADVFWITPLSLALAAAFAGLVPLSDAVCWRAAETGGFSYRRPRAVGSFAFLSATLGVGLLIEATDIDGVVYVIAGALIFAATGGLLAQGLLGRRAGDGARPPPSLVAGLKLLARRRFALIVAASAAIQASHAVLYVYGSIHWRALGFSDPAIGALWSWGVLSEIALFAVGGGLLARYGAPRCLGVAAALAAARWGAMSFDPGVAGAALLQTLHAASFALTHLAALSLVAREAPPELAGSAQGLMTAASGGVAMMAATSIAAWAFPLYGGGAYWIGVVFALAGVVFARLLASARPTT